MWALGGRKFDKSLNQRTTGLSEGWNRKVKRRYEGIPGNQQKRMDWLIYMFIELVEVHISARELLAYLGMVTFPTCPLSFPLTSTLSPLGLISCTVCPSIVLIAHTKFGGCPGPVGGPGGPWLLG